MQEFEVIRRFFSRPAAGAVLGIGDDCALIAPTLGKEWAITTDMLVCGRHFLPDVDAEKLGWKTLAVNLSDLAAMGATPCFCTLSIALPLVDEQWLAAFSAGFFACAEKYKILLIGGDTTEGPLTFSVTALGEIPAGEALTRKGASAGDLIWVSGATGLAALGLHLRQKDTDLENFLPKNLQNLCFSALETPQPRVALGESLRGIASAAIDISDGLLADLSHIARQSNLHATLHLQQLPSLPYLPDLPPALCRIVEAAQFSGGDDYELCFTTPPARRAQIAAIAEKLKLPLACIGEMRPEEKNLTATGVTVFDENGTVRDFQRQGYVHF